MSAPIAILNSKGPIKLGKMIGKGGEGEVYEIVGDPSRVVKLYEPPKPDRGPKIAAMLPLKNDRLLSLAAWPLDLLHSAHGQFVGFVMPRVNDRKDIHNLYNPRSRKAEFPDANWPFLVHVAANTARAFAAIHEAGCVIGDVNERVVLVSNTATVQIIDCDSFQFAFSGKRFLCDVGVVKFTPPELQNKPLRGVLRTANHDNFGLAILAFYLLFMGKHPFGGCGPGQMDTEEQAIREFRFAYGANRAAYQIEPPPTAPPISIASPPVAELFERAFSPSGARDGGRPTAKEWISALAGLEKEVKTCHVNPSHQHYRGLAHCPWCQMEAATGVPLFIINLQRRPQIFVGDLTALWAKVVGIQTPGEAPPITKWDNLVASPEAKAQGRSRREKQALGYGAMAVVMIGLIAAAPNATFLLVIGGILAALAVEKWGTSGVDLGKFREAVKSAESNWNAVKIRWDQDAADHRFVTHLRHLQHEYDQLGELLRVRDRRYKELERGREKLQRQQFLEQFDINSATISGIGFNLKWNLANNGIETAWDVTEQRVRSVYLFSDTRTYAMVSWRNEVEAKFRFDPTKGVDPQDLAALDQEIDETKRKLEQTLTNGLQDLTQIRDRILSQRTALKPLMEEAAKSLAQARADLKAA